MDLVDTHNNNKGTEVTLNKVVILNNRVVTLNNKEVIILLNSHNKHTEVNKDITDSHNHNPFTFNNHKKVAVVQVLQELVAVLVWQVHVYVVAQKRCASTVSSKKSIVSFVHIIPQ
ncbi:hypothetical protein L7F22_068030 [Adiantum nelumboides]|nr:hypothetical protein [Adiantum nelumboides]